MKKLFVLSLLSLLLAVPSFGANAAKTDATNDAPTYYADVLPVLQENCQTCHRPLGENIGGMIAPMALMTYEDTRPWAKSIARAVASRDMPPWFATEATRGVFHHERVMTDEDIQTIVAWSSTGAKAGDAAQAPARKKFVEEGSDGWSLGKPDLVVPMEEPYWVSDELADININFTATITEEMLPEAAWVNGIEFKVGTTAVHHMCASAEKPGAGSLFSGKLAGGQLGCIALGSESQAWPEGYGMELVPGSTIRFSMHYNKEPGEGSGFFDQSEIGFHFTDADVRPVQYDSIGNNTFEIPPNEKRWKVGAARYFPVDADLLALWPHAHLRAVAARYEAFYPDGTQELLLDVPEYDQEWQTTYQYKTPKKLPAGTRIQYSMWFDNSPERGAERGFDSNEAVILGTATTDEMMLGFINYAPSVPMDMMSVQLGLKPEGAGGE